INAWKWHSDRWEQMVEISNHSAGGDTEFLAAKYTTDGSQGMVLGEYDVYSGSALVNRVLNYRYLTSIGWAPLGSIDATPKGSFHDAPSWITLKANPLSAKALEGVIVQDILILTTMRWDGSTWTLTTVDKSTDQQSHRGADFEWDYLPSTNPP